MPIPPNLTPLRDFEVGTTLVDDMVPVADDLRQLYTEFGVHTYHVFLVWVGWLSDDASIGFARAQDLYLESAAPGAGRPAFVNVGAVQLVDPTQIGVGRPILLQEIELAPMPRVVGMGGIQNTLRAEGLTEEGGVTVDRISESYTEDVLMGLLPQFRNPSFSESLRPGVMFFWEIQEVRNQNALYLGSAGFDYRPDKGRMPRRRYHVANVPQLDRTSFQWTVSLVRADGERGRNGEIAFVGSP